MNKASSTIILVFLLSIIGYFDVYSQDPLWKIASDYEKVGKYSDAIRLKKQMAKEDYGTEWYIDDIAGIARCYSYTSENDSTLWYGTYAIDLAKGLFNKADSVAEEYIINSALCFYRSNLYTQAITASEMVLSLREKLNGRYSSKYLEWLGVMSYQAFNYRQLDDMVKYCKMEIDLVKEGYGLQSSFYEETISSIRGYAHQLVDVAPEFTTDWIQPYYIELQEANILPKFQYEFEILQLEGFLLMENLKSADQYARKLERWTYSINSNIIPLEDRVRISLKLANHYLHIGDHYKSRYSVEEAWKCLIDANVEPTLTHLVDRHIVERQLRMDTLGRSRINAEWIIETATPIIEAWVEDAGTIAFFYESRAWAYEELEEYDNAISDIKNAIRLNPLYSRKKKLAQFYLEKREYDLAEKLYLELYNDPNIPDVGIRSIEADLTSLYWLWGKLDKLTIFLSKDYANVKSDVRNAFAFMDEDEREKYLEKSLLGSTIYFDIYTSSSNGEKQWQYGNQMAYNLALIQKGLLLSTTRDIDTILQNAPDSIQDKIKEYENLCNLFGSPVFSESGILREKRIELMQYVAKQPQFLSQLNYTWEDVRNHLNDNDAAIEFINLWGITLDNLKDATPSIGALILRKDSEFPVFVKLTNDSTVTNLFVFDEEGERVNDLLYSNEFSSQLYHIIWEPLLPYLEGVQAVYYSPTGIIQDINLDWIGYDNSSMLCSRYNLYRLSSTREICNSRKKLFLDDVVLYGDITYSINTSPITESNKSKYRSTTRAGFHPLKATAIELDSIIYILDSRQITSKDIRKDIATEVAFREMSGNSPEILHIATHGFYYSRDAIRKEYQFGNFMAFQSINPELYHSGLALTGAQDTWYNETGDISKYLDLDSNNDGILLSSEISRLDLRMTDLVVLSACETALGNVTSEGVYGLQRAFKLAGVNSLIMSLWKVDDDATQLLMTSFYNNYMNGMSKREALIKAQKKVQNTPGFEDPYNWAAFILLDGLN